MPLQIHCTHIQLPPANSFRKEYQKIGKNKRREYKFYCLSKFILDSMVVAPPIELNHIDGAAGGGHGATDKKNSVSREK